MATIGIKIEPYLKGYRAHAFVQGFENQPNPVEEYFGPARNSLSEAHADGEEIVSMMAKTFPGIEQVVTRKSMEA